MQHTQRGSTRRWMVMAALVLALVGADAFAQSEEDALRFSQRSPATGARMTGMAGASTAGVADWSAVFSNPAGLGWMDRSQLVGSLNNLSAANDATYQASGFSSLSNTSATRTSLANLGYVYRAPTVRGSLAFGVGLNQTHTFERSLFYSGENGNNSITDFFMPVPGEFEITEDAGDDGIFGTNDDLIDVEFFRDLSFLAYETFAIDLDLGLLDAGVEVPFLPAVTAGTVEQSGDVIEEGGVNELSFGGAVAAAPGVMIGASANFTFGSYRFDRFFEEFDLNNDNDGTGGTTDFDALEFTQTLETDLFGVNARGGVSAELTPMLRAGLTIETPTYFAVDETFSSELSTFFDNNDSYNVIDGPFAAADYRIVTPWRLGGGVALKVAGLLLAADAELVDWSQMRMKPGDDFDDELYFNDVNRRIRTDFDAVVNTRLGAEYVLGPVALRGGFAYQPSPYAVEDLEIDRAHRFVSLGVGFRAGDQVEINAGFVRESFEDRYVPYGDVVDAPVVIEDIDRDRLTVGVRFFF